MDFDDRLLHYALFAGGMLFISVAKVGFERLANRFWNKAEAEAADLKAFKAWKKAGKPAA